MAVSSSLETTYKTFVNPVIFPLTCKKIVALMWTTIYISTAAKFATLAHSQFLHFDSLTELGEDEVSQGFGGFFLCVNV